MTDPLKAMAERARREPFFLGHMLELYAVSGGLDDDALAARLGCADLTGLRLCRAVRLDPAWLRQDVAQVAAAFGLEPARLMEAVKRSAVLAALERKAAAEPTLFMAARDREEG